MSEDNLRPIHTESVTPMPDPVHDRDQEEQTFGSDETGLREAADARQASDTIEPEPIEYRQPSGEKVPVNESVTAERAARDLSNYRNSTDQAKEYNSDLLTAETIDALRATRAGIQPEPVQAQPQQAEVQHAPQPEAQPVQTTPDGVDPGLVAELEARSPQFKQALAEEMQSVAVAKQGHIDAARQNAQMSMSSLLAGFPELQGVPADQLKTALKVLGARDPQRAHAAVQHIEATNQVMGEYQRLQAEQYQEATKQYQKQWQQWTEAEDQKFNQLAPEMADREAARRTGDAAVSTLKGVGFSADDIRRAYTGDATLSLRDHRAQLLLLKASRYDAAMAARVPVNNVPPVQRPGVGGARADEYDSSQMANLNQRLNTTHNLKDAARLLAARRANKG